VCGSAVTSELKDISVVDLPVTGNQYNPAGQDLRGNNNNNSNSADNF